MKLFQVTNGYTGSSYARVNVIAETKERAIELASRQYKKDAYSWVTPISEEPKYPESYWTDLEATLLSEDLAEEFVGEVEE